MQLEKSLPPMNGTDFFSDSQATWEVDPGGLQGQFLMFNYGQVISTSVVTSPRRVKYRALIVHSSGGPPITLNIASVPAACGMQNGGF